MKGQVNEPTFHAWKIVEKLSRMRSSRIKSSTRSSIFTWESLCPVFNGPRSLIYFLQIIKVKNVAHAFSKAWEKKTRLHHILTSTIVASITTGVHFRFLNYFVSKGNKNMGQIWQPFFIMECPFVLKEEKSEKYWISYAMHKEIQGTMKRLMTCETCPLLALLTIALF